MTRMEHNTDARVEPKIAENTIDPRVEAVIAENPLLKYIGEGSIADVLDAAVATGCLQIIPANA
jgi:hypothetical protein